MASKCVTTVLNAYQEVFTAPLNKVCRITGIQISNGTANPSTVTIRDTFTTTTSNGAASAVVVETKKVIYSITLTQYSWEDKMKSIKILGKCEVIGSDAAQAVDVTVMWE